MRISRTQSSPIQRAMHTDTSVRPWLEQALGEPCNMPLTASGPELGFDRSALSIFMFMMSGVVHVP
eukprot:jgi/Astpho2/5845/Aster-02355